MEKHECIHNGELGQMKIDIREVKAETKEIKETINGKGSEPGIKGTLTEVNITMKAVASTMERSIDILNKNVESHDKTIQSVLKAGNEWEVTMRLMKQKEIDEEKRKMKKTSRIRYAITTAVAISALIFGIIQYLEKKAAKEENKKTVENIK